MQHLCIILHNPQTLEQHSPVPLISCIISALQSTIRNLSAMGFPGSQQSIQLFLTSQPSYPVSSFQHDELHLNWQIKNIKCEMQTYPGECIQNAVDHVSRFRVMTQTQTLMGYREGYIHQPALFIFITDKMPTRKGREMIKLVVQHKIKLRSEQVFVILQYCPPAPADKFMQTQENFRKNIQTKEETKLMIDFASQIGADLKFVVSYEGLIGTIWNVIENFKPSLRIQLVPLKMSKKFNNQFALSTKHQRLTSILNSSLLQLNLFPLRLWKIPIPFNLKYSQENGGIRISYMEGLQFNVDFSKRYVDVISPFLPQNRYQLQKTSILQSLQNELTSQQHYPLFYQYRNSQILVGLLTLSRLGSQIRLYFGNFTQLNNILAIIKNRNPQKLLQSTLYAYLTSLPAFYLKFIKPFLDKLNLVINYSLFENTAMSPSAIANQKLLNTRSYEHRQMLRLKAMNAQNHKNNTSQCCPIYSQHFAAYSQSLSPYPPSSFLPQSNNIQKYFHQLLKSMAEFKTKIGITDYLSMSMIESVPMAHQLQKYSRMRKGGQEDFNENITMSLGNPYKKKRKQSDDTVMGGEQGGVQISNNGSNSNIHSIPNSTPAQSPSPSTNPNGQNNPLSDNAQKGSEGRQMQAQAKDPPQLEYKVNTPIILTNEVVDRVNSIPVTKVMLINFDGSHINSQLLLRNEEILNRIKSKK